MGASWPPSRAAPVRGLVRQVAGPLHAAAALSRVLSGPLGASRLISPVLSMMRPYSSIEMKYGCDHSPYK